MMAGVVTQSSSPDEIQTDLIHCYKRLCYTLPVFPIFDDKNENILDIYKPPTMYSVEEKKEITRIEQVFCKDSKPCNQIYIYGGAGMGKTSFCTFMCKLWCVGKVGDKLDDKHKELQKDVEYISKFDFVFYISLRDSYYFDVIDMIEEQYLKNHDRFMIQDILRKQHCLILMDGLDEWHPKRYDKQRYQLPVRFYSDNCVYITTCRPYRIEGVRLSRHDVDHYILMTGIDGDASESYVRGVIQYMNNENSTNREVSDFMKDINNCGLGHQLRIPMVASHLVVLWFEIKLTDMPRALIYANILEMLFRRAKKREVEFPPPTASLLQLPYSLSGLEYLNNYVSILYNVCHLSFISLFKLDENVTNLVFTRQQLQAKPYCFSIEETDFLCKIGILSEKEVLGCFTVERLKVIFIHKCYVEMFASLFTSSFDRDNVYSDATQSWKTLNDVLQFENFFLLLAGFSYIKVKSSMENVYFRVSEDLITCRRNSIFHYSLRYSSKEQIEQLQDIVINCYKEVSRSNVTNIVLKLEDFIFDDKSDVDILRQILLSNTTCVKSLYSVEGKYYDAFDEIKNLHCLHVDKLMSGDYVKFTKCMLNNQSTLHTVCIEGSSSSPPLLPVLPVKSLHQLTSLSLSLVTIHHDNLCDLVKFLSDNVHLEHIKLFFVSCDKHSHGDSDCTLTLNLLKHTQLTLLYLDESNILCKKVNTSSLKSITLCPPLLSKWIDGGYIDIFDCIKSSQLEHLDINGTPMYMLDDKTMRTLTAAVKTIPFIKSLTLRWMNFDVDVLLEIHPDVTQVEIKLYYVTMSRQWFHCFIKSCVNTKSVIKVVLDRCKFTTVDVASHRELSDEESVKYMSEYLTSIQNVKITHNGDYRLHLETTSQ